MQTKDKNNKTKNVKKNETPIIPIPAKKVAEITGASESMVKRVRQGKTKGNGKMCRQIQITDNLLTRVINTGFEKVTAFIKDQIA